MKETAVYARVSSDRQAREATIDSQLEALVQRAEEDGHKLLPSDLYADEGYSGSSLLRPALESLRDRAAEGRLDLVYIHSPDRLSRKLAYQALLLDELGRAGVEIVFLNHPVGESPEDQLLLQMQGSIAEYERAKILERNRRGKIHWARRGSASVLSCAPYGYYFVRKSDHEAARYEILENEAMVVRRIFHWCALEQLPLAAIARRLKADGVLTRTGLARWDRGTIWGILKNPAYTGKACYGKTEAIARQRRNRKSKPVPRHSKSSSRQRPQEQWIPIPVPAIVEEQVFDLVQQQLERNKAQAKRNNKNGEYLLRGLLVCSHCKHALYAKPISSSPRRGKIRRYVYYRCTGTDSYRYEGGRICDNCQVRADELDGAVWQSVIELLTDPERVLSEFARRRDADGSDLKALKSQRDGLLRDQRRLQASLQRLMDAYEAEVLSLEELRPRVEATRCKLKSLDAQIVSAESAVAKSIELTGIATQLSDFRRLLDRGLDAIGFEERYRLVRLLVTRVEVYQKQVSVVYRVPSVASGHG